MIFSSAVRTNPVFRQLSSSKKLVFATLVTYVQVEDCESAYACVSIKRLAMDCSLSSQTVGSALKEIARLGLAVRTMYGPEGSIYKIPLSALTAKRGGGR